MGLVVPVTAGGLSDVDQTTIGAGKVLTNTASGGKASSWQTPLAQTVASYTPTDQSGASLTFASASGTYVQIARIVYMTCDITYPVTASGSPAAISMPVLALGGPQALVVGFNASATTFMALSVGSNPSKIQFYLLTNGTASNVNLSGARIVISGCYQSFT
jgi:hypothetical protein